MKQRITLLFITILLAACTKDEVNQNKIETITTLKNEIVESFAKEKLNPGDFSNYDFSSVLAIVKKDTLRGWQVNAKTQTNQEIDFLIINASDDKPISIFRNTVKYVSKSGTKMPIALTNTDMQTGKLKNYYLHSDENTLQNQGKRNPVRKALVYVPTFSTLPPVVVVGHRTIPGANLTPGTYTALISARLFGLLQTNGSTGGSESGGNGDQAWDNGTNLEYILPAGSGTGGSPIIVDFDQIPVMSIYTFDNTTYVWTPEDDYPGKANGFPFDWWNNLGFTPHEQTIYEQLRNERETVVDEINTPCHGTNHLPGGLRKPGTNLPFPGTAEHALIQLDYMIKHPGSTREYLIPGAGRADIVNIPLREIFEIKPRTQIDLGRIEVENYVIKATIECGLGQWHKGFLYPTTILPHPTDPNANLQASKYENGLIIYEKVPKNTQPAPIVVPQTLTITESLKKLLKDVLNSEEIGLTEAYLIYFLKLPEHQELRNWIKENGPTVAASIIIGTIAADIATGGASIWDDAATINLGILIARVGALL